MFRSITKTILVMLAMLSSTSAMAQVTWFPMTDVIEIKYSCRTDAHCAIHADLARDIKSPVCVGYVPATKTTVGKLGECNFTRMTCPKSTSTTWTTSLLVKRLCVSFPAPTCQTDAKCDDENPCTTDSCVNNKCVFTGPTECTTCTLAAECDDDNACTADSCVAGKCSNLGEEKCVACQDDTDCGPLSDLTCAPEGDSDIFFTEGVRGVCIIETGLCRSVSTTEYCPLACAGDMTSCWSNEAEFCDDGNTCTVDDFNYLTDACEYTPVTDGKPCQDGSVCTGNDTCDQGTCSGTMDTGCDDGDVCTTDSCDEAEGCSSTVKVCNDGVNCTADSCNASTGACESMVKNCDDSNSCTTDSCNSATGACVNVGTTCNDNNACTADSCDSSGNCVNTTKDCADGNVCTADSCDSVTGACSNLALTDTTTVCTDNNVCTANDACATGVCTGVTKCDDNDACTTDSCSASGVCSNLGKTCNDSNPCTTDSCDSSGNCLNLANTAACNDGSACTSTDVCANKVCAGATVVCNDNNACTTDSCNPASGCVFATISGCVPSASCSLASKTGGAGIKPLVDFVCQGAFTDIGQSSETTYTGTVGTSTYNTSASGFYCWLKSLNGIPINWGAMTTQAQKLAACKQAMVGLNACNQEVPISVTTDAWGACVVSFNTAP